MSIRQTVFVVAALAMTLGLSAQELFLLSSPEDPTVLGAQGNAPSRDCRLGGNRFVVFSSRAQNLVAGDRNASEDVFLRDLNLGVLQRVSVDDAGDEAPGDSLRPDVSDDGRWVVFESAAVLAPGATGTGIVHVYLRDRMLGTTTMVSRTAAAVGNGSSMQPRISGDGGQVVFQSFASNLVTGDTDNCPDIFVYSVATGGLLRASTTSTGQQANSCHHDPDIADDGASVVFLSDASDLVADDNNFHRDVFRKDLLTGGVERLSVSTAGGDPDRPSFRPSVSGDGQSVVFASAARNLVDGDRFLKTDVFLHDSIQVPPITRISVPDAGGEADAASTSPAISSDGQTVVFESRASNLTAGQIQSPNQPFVYDRSTDVLTPLLTIPAAEATQLASSSDGSVVCAQSPSELVAEDRLLNTGDVYVWDGPTATWALASVTDTPQPSQSNGHSVQPDISDDARFVVFQSDASVLDEALADDGRFSDIYFLDRETAAIERFPETVTGLPGNGDSQGPTISADGRYVAFMTRATNLVNDDNEPNLDVMLVDRLTQELRLISRGVANAEDSELAQIDGSGRRVVFRSRADDLVAGDSNQVPDIFLWERDAPLSRLSVSSSETQANGQSGAPRLSSDGNYAVFVSSADNLDGADQNQADDVFLRDIESGSTQRVSEDEFGLGGDAGSLAADVAAGGRYVAYVTEARNLAPSNREGLNVLRWDRFTGSSENVSLVLPVDEQITAELVRISDNGRYVFFSSNRQLGLLSQQNLWRFDTRENELLRLTSTSAGQGSQAPLHGGAIHQSGHYVVFSAADDRLTPADHNGFYDVVLSDLRGEPGTLGFDQGQLVVDESVGVVHLPVRRRDGARGGVSIDYAAVNGSALGGRDFARVSGVLIFGDADDNDQLISIQILDDAENEPDESFLVTLTNVQGGASLGLTTQFFITIIDNDPLVDPVFADSFEAPGNLASWAGDG